MGKLILIVALSVGLAEVALAAETRGLREKIPSVISKPESLSQETKDHPSTTAPDQAEEITRLIRQLGDPSWQVREQATQKLIAIGTVVRRALLEATRSLDAEVVARARRILEKIPWAVTPQDPPEVAKLLENYQALDREERKAVVVELFSLGRFKANQALLRIVDFEDQEEISALAANLLRDYSFGSMGEPVRKYSFQSERPSVLALQGWAWRLHQPKRAVGFFEKSLEMHQLGLAAGTVSPIEKSCIVEILGWLLEIGAAEPVRVALPKFERLFENDTRIYYVRAKAAEISGDLERVRVLVKQALDFQPKGGIEPAEIHSQAAAFLRAHQWHEWEASEWRSIFTLAHPSTQAKVLAHFGLGWLAAEDGRFEEAADHYLTAGEMAEDAHLDLGTADPQGIQAEGQWNRARAMMAKGDLTRLEDTLKDMLRLSPGHPDGAGELARFLMSRNRTEEAEKVLSEARAELEKEFEAADLDEPTYHNNLAWLYVVATTRIDQAVEEAQKAVAAAPYEVAFADTLAEAYFRSGQKAKAIEKERYALSLEPDNGYLKRQLKRFETKDKNEPVPLQR